ncbi:MAG TPA: DUF4416 family protein [Thermodesulfobacteriota bacterium]|nr:DUF4416 family protein [Thermodesulfobacteriota bacterium]
MSRLRQPQDVKLVMSLLARRDEDLAPALSAADGEYGPVDFVSERLPFDFTDYYEAEMGAELKRRIVSFGPLLPSDRLVRVKHWANEQESRTADEKGDRRVNIDPGFLSESKFVLATGKDYTHRIYLGEGVYGDLTLTYRKGDFSPLPWTYPDYASEPILGILRMLRKKVLWERKRVSNPISDQDGI